MIHLDHMHLKYPNIYLFFSCWHKCGNRAQGLWYCNVLLEWNCMLSIFLYYLHSFQINKTLFIPTMLIRSSLQRLRRHPDKLILHFFLRYTLYSRVHNSTTLHITDYRVHSTLKTVQKIHYTIHSAHFKGHSIHQKVDSWKFWLHITEYKVYTVKNR